MMETGSLMAGLRFVAVVILFAICGAVSSVLFLKQFPNQMSIGFPLPFALLCTLLFMRTRLAAFAVPLIVVVWNVAEFVAVSVGMTTHDSFLPSCAGGLVGGLGLVLCAAVCYRPLFSPMYFAIGALVGSLSAISFVPWVELYMSHPNAGPPKPPQIAFAIWQAAAGTCLYAFCSYAKNVRAEDAQGSDPVRVL